MAALFLFITYLVIGFIMFFVCCYYEGKKIVSEEEYKKLKDNSNYVQFSNVILCSLFWPIFLLDIVRKIVWTFIKGLIDEFNKKIDSKHNKDEES